MDETTTRKRTQRTATEWRSIMARFEASGLAGEAFCAAGASAGARSGAGGVASRTRTLRAPGTAGQRSSSCRTLAPRRGTRSSTSAPAWCCGCADRGADPGRGAAHLAVRRAGGHAALLQPRTSRSGRRGTPGSPLAPQRPRSLLIMGRAPQCCSGRTASVNASRRVADTLSTSKS